jgi:hypothetical protein
MTNKLQRHIMVFIAINALHVSGGSSAYHQELKLIHDSGKKQKKIDKYPMLCMQFELLMMGGGTV